MTAGDFVDEPFWLGYRNEDIAEYDADAAAASTSNRDWSNKRYIMLNALHQRCKKDKKWQKLLY